MLLFTVKLFFALLFSVYQNNLFNWKLHKSYLSVYEQEESEESMYEESDGIYTITTRTYFICYRPTSLLFCIHIEYGNTVMEIHRLYRG